MSSTKRYQFRAHYFIHKAIAGKLWIPLVVFKWNWINWLFSWCGYYGFAILSHPAITMSVDWSQDTPIGDTAPHIESVRSTFVKEYPELAGMQLKTALAVLTHLQMIDTYQHFPLTTRAPLMRRE